jgi:SAM-dependent methyltransferase
MQTALKGEVIRHFGVANFGRMRNALYLVEVGWNLLTGVRHRCNLCGYEGRFRAYGHPPRYGAQCPRCLSLERHRLLKLWVDGHGAALKGKTLLHFAPEPSTSKFLKASAGAYVSADLDPNYADRVVNIEDMALPDSFADVAVVSHVLEHVDDRKALRELYRVLKPDGVVVIMIPIVEGWDATYENASIVAARDRALHFGQWDHVRFYGRDIRERIRQAGFSLSEYTANEPEIQVFGLSRGEKIFFASRQSSKETQSAGS